MIYAILSDIHANIQALRLALADARAQGAKKIICLGDIVGYGPAPVETAALVKATASVALMGNHDAAVCGLLSTTDFNPIAADAVVRHRKALAPADLDALKALPYVYEGCDFIAAHGDFTAPRRFLYVDTPEAAAENFAVTDSPLLFVGHTHVPRLGVIGPSGTAYLTDPQDFTMEEGKRYIVNPGAVGYPREKDGICRSSYVLFDTTAKTIVFRALPFRIESVMQRGTPRKSLRRTIATWVAVGLGMLAALGLGWGLRHIQDPAPTATVDKLTVMATRLTLTDADACVVANVRLEKGSCPVLLKIAFLAANGTTNDIENVVVKKANDKRHYRIPPKSATALFTLERQNEDDNPKVAAFAPHTLPRK